MNNIQNRTAKIVKQKFTYSGKKTDTIISSRAKISENIPKIFWKYYDLYRRNQITTIQYIEKTGLTASEIKHFLNEIRKKQ